MKYFNSRARYTILFVFIAVILITVSVVLFISNCIYRITELELKTEGIGNSIRIVQLTDLHSYNFGNNNKDLVLKISNLKPDIIVMTGDMIDVGKSVDILFNTVDELSDVADIYYSLGNQESEYIIENSSFIRILESLGVTVLEKEYRDITVNGNSIRLGGTSGYALGVEFWEASKGKSAEEYYDKAEFSEQRFLLEFEDTDRLKILLCHQPEGATLWNNNDWFDVDLIFSGHIHGGMVRLPFIGGLYAPEEGCFPEFDYGLYEINGNTTYISSGLSNSNGVPRFNNIPEIVLFNLVSE